MDKIDYEKELIDSLEELIKTPINELSNDNNNVKSIEQYKTIKFLHDNSKKFSAHIKDKIKARNK